MEGGHALCSLGPDADPHFYIFPLSPQNWKRLLFSTQSTAWASAREGLVRLPGLVSDAANMEESRI